MTENAEQRLTDQLAGTPVTKPEERRQYLGSLRERLYLRLTVAEITTTAIGDFQAALKQIHDPAAKLLLNGKLATSILQPYLKAATAQQLAFTVVNDETAQTTNTATGLLIVAPTAINRDKIQLADYVTLTPVTAKSKRSLFERLFD
ncbi:YueI family protein [Loigolactobacillus bifermentans]|uniref:DUF1694 domain-containing protein n=1 Tax=Loigolactobacillus bifermentans DSM 20003 TaxID=1423726 RepID=A0A0R1GKR6_9LACO|nr:YueI family protein [Loigolactobacillus bifermentans]KRK34619.1 hypothetical protein FC07_GL000369 [Loigolactobacillus bifermentans DSM 20003]QGG61111.1 DUF1694 domain-containing protein [Loigolactobacillus bifermentans]